MYNDDSYLKNEHESYAVSQNAYQIIQEVCLSFLYHIQQIFYRALEFVLPHYCLLCQAQIDSKKGFCLDCWKTLPFLPNHSCYQCGFVFEYPIDEKRPICLSCQKDPPAFDQAKAIWKYNDVTKSLILKFKYADRIDMAGCFSAFFIQAGIEFFQDVDYICPVPLHWTRQWKRGYNQAAILSDEFMKSYHFKGILPVKDLLIRHRRTKPLGRLYLKKRQDNLAGAFSVHSLWQERIYGKIILIIDDVFTTGSTVNECAKLLKNHGAKAVKIITVTRVCK